TLGFLSNASAARVYRYQIMLEDFNELTKLSGSLNIPAGNGWPVSGAEAADFKSVQGITFSTKDTLKRTEGANEIWVFRFSVSRISLGSLNLTGTLPALTFSELVYFNISFNKISGPIPVLNFPKCQELWLNRNQFTGTIPNFNMPALINLELYTNQLTGTIPNFNFPKLKTLELTENQLEGQIPDFKLPALKWFSLAYNKLSGTIPNFNLPELQILDLGHNNLTGTIPLFNCPKALHIRLYENQLTGSIPQFNMPQLSNLALGDNKLTGTIPKFNMPQLILFNVKNNQLTGDFDNSGLPQLMDLYLQNNPITGLPDLKSISPQLERADVSGCSLTFEDIEPNLDIKSFKYSGQQKVETYQKLNGLQVTFYVKMKEQNCEYKWRKIKNGVNTLITGAIKDSLTITVEPSATYYCLITNTKVPGLTLVSKTTSVNSCVSFSQFEFCLEGNTWEKLENNILASTGKVLINNMLTFEGTFLLDTLNVALRATGEFYVQNIPIPGGTIGKYSLGSGTYALTLLGEKGTITKFLDSKMSQLGQLCGGDLKLDNLQLVGGRRATGIKLDCKISVPGISGKCDKPEDKDTDFELKGLQITTEGIGLEGVKVTDIGLIRGYCLKNLTVNYNPKKDILSSGATIAIPFGEIEGGFKLEKGKIDSIAWRIEAEKTVFVIGTTTVGVKGFFGHISNITKPAIEVELGGIFGDITSDIFYRVTASGRTIWPKVFEVKGTGQFLKPPLLYRPYQIAGSLAMSYDYGLQMFKVDLNGKIGTPDEKEWLMDSHGIFKIFTKTSPPTFSGELSGKIHLKEFDDGFPYIWLNSLFTLPVDAETKTMFIYGKNKVMYGNATFQNAKYGPYSLKYVLNLDKNYGDDDFLYWEASSTTKSAQLKNADLLGDMRHDIQIPENTGLAVVGVKSQVKAPTTVLKSPSGKIYSSSNELSSIILSLGKTGKDAFWTIQKPETGKWELTLQNPATTDSVIIFLQPVDPGFKVSMAQSGYQVTVTWKGSLFKTNQKISMMLDNDGMGFDGIKVTEGNAAAGSLVFAVNDSLSQCNYSLFAQVTDDFNVYSSYADGIVNIPKAILRPPVIESAKLIQSIGKIRISFTDNLDPKTVGYILSVFDKNGKDSVYAILNRGAGSIDLAIPDAGTKTIKMTAFDSVGLTGCPSAPKSIDLTSNSAVVTTEQNSLTFYPNPTTGEGTVRFTLPESTAYRISVVDLLGRSICPPIQGKKPAGTWETALNLDHAPVGIYFIVLQTDRLALTHKFIISR
ncbi:MAG: hypothetical protein C0397_10845, partial [Odoribacter sp.]|nr:hypothetical protein [Odoribacter sp.]